MPQPSQLSGVNLPGLLALLLILAVVFAPVLLGRGARRSGEADEGSDDGGGDGGGGGPPAPSGPPGPPPAGIPLDDAQPAGVRLRTHERLVDRRRVRRRERTRERERVRSVVDRATSAR